MMHFEGSEDFNTFYCVVSVCTSCHLDALASVLTRKWKRGGILTDPGAWEFYSLLLAALLV